MPASRPCSGECRGLRDPRGPPRAPQSLCRILPTILHPAQVRRSCARGQDDGEFRRPRGHWAKPPRCPQAMGAAGPATAPVLSPLPRLSQLDSLCAAAQALHALRSPDADLLPVLTAAVEVRGRGSLAGKAWSGQLKAGLAGEWGGNHCAGPPWQHPEYTPFFPGRVRRPQQRPPGTWRLEQAEPATSAQPSCCSPTRGQWRWRPCYGPCWRGCGAEGQLAVGHPRAAPEVMVRT